jgi:hypothetical protein
MRKLLWLALAALAGCWPEAAPPPALELDLYDQPVTCDAARGTCRAPDGRAAAPEYHRIRVRLTELPSSTTYPKGGLLITGRLQRPSGNTGYLSIQIPMVRGAVTDGTGEPKVEYTEHRGPELLFSATHAAGRIELSWDRSCPCQTGRLELLLRDAGADGLIDTADDQVRRLSRARLRRGDRPFCHRRSVLDIRPDLLVVGTRACPVKRSGSSGGGYACGWGLGVGWSTGWNDDGWYDEEWDGDWDGGWDDECFDDGWCDCEWTDDDYYYGDGWSDDGWGGEWGDDGWESGWGDDGWGGGGGSGSSSSGSSGGWDDDDWWGDGGSSGWGGGGDDWGDDDWWDDSGSDDDWGSDDSGSDWGDDDWGDDGGDDDWWDD